jgi:rubrerythrin
VILQRNAKELTPRATICAVNAPAQRLRRLRRTMTAPTNSDQNRATHDALLATFLASSFFAEDEATPVVEKLLRHPTDSEERALLLSYAAEEDGHARILDAELARRGLPKGQPFWIQKVFRRISARTTLLIQFYHVEILAGCFYGAVAARVRDEAARALLRRLLQDEARHIRLHRELLARQLARVGVLGRLKARFVAFAFRWAFFVTAWYQARQLAPILGDAGPPLRRKILRKLRADIPFLFAARDRTPVPLDWWWSRARATNLPAVAAA